MARPAATRLVIVPEPLIDVDARMLATDPGLVTTLAVQLEACMLCDDAAQARYAAIYGREWVSLADMDDAAPANTDHIATCVA